MELSPSSPKIHGTYLCSTVNVLGENVLCYCRRIMRNGTCAVCSSPEEIRNGVNNALRENEPLRTIAARSAFSRAGLSRHRRDCLGIRREDKAKNKAACVRHATGIAQAGQFRLHVVYGDDEPQEPLGESDWLIRVQYFQPALHEYGNPRALISSVFDEATRAHLARFPSARISTDADAPPSEEFLRQSELAANEFLPVINLPEPEPPPAPPAAEPTPSACSHVWREVAASVTRCEACGEQKPVLQVAGVRRDWKDERKRNPFRSFGRFG